MVSDFIPRTPADLDDPGLSRERAFQVPDARVVLADHALLQRDFPWLRDDALLARHPRLSQMSGAARAEEVRAILDAWLVDHAAVLSAPHFEPNEVGSAPRRGGPVQALRPTRYGRALVVPAGDERGLLDVKGAGVSPGNVPRRARHANGVCELAEVLVDVIVQSVVDEIFRRAAPRLRTVPVYGVIDLGFDVRSETGASVAAAVQVRRAHRRPIHSLEIPVRGSAEERVKAEVEMLLRSYGLTSSNLGARFQVWDRGGRLRVAYGDEEITDLSRDEQSAVRRLARVHMPGERRVFDAINVQLTREVSALPASGTLVDFGHYRFARRFDRPVVTLVRDRLLRWGAALWPQDPSFVQPAPALAVSLRDFGIEVSDDDHGPLALRLFGQDLSRRWRDGSLSRGALARTVRGVVERSKERWSRREAPGASW